jgi:hypothetical protein
VTVLVGRRIFGQELHRRHVVGSVLALAAAGLILAWTLLPGAGLRWGLVKTLRGLGMVEVSVSDADLSLFGGNLVVRKMVARPPMGTALGVKDFTLRFRWAPLLNKRVVLDRVALEGVEIDIHREEGGGFIINGLPLAVAATPPGQPEDAATEWGIDVATLELSDSRIVLTDGDARAEIAVQRMVVENLHSRDPRSAPRFVLQGSLNGAPVEIRGSVSPFADQPGFDITTAMHGLDLAQLRSLAAKDGVTGLGGRADITLAANGAMTAAGLNLHASGRLEVSDAAVASTVQVSAGKLALDLHQADWSGQRLSLSAGLDATTLSVKAPDGGEGAAAALKLDLPKLSWEGGKLDLTGSLDGTTVSGKATGGSGSAASLKLDASALRWDGKLDWQGGLTLSKAVVSVAGVEAQPDSLAWTGGLTVDTTPASPSGRAEGKLDLGPLRLTYGDTAMGQKRATTEGWVAFGQPGKAPVTAALKLAAEGVNVSDPANGQGWLALERLDLTGITAANNGTANVERLVANGIAALKRDGRAGYPWRIEARSLRLDHLSRTEDGDLALADGRMDGLIARITRTKDGFLGLPKSEPKPAAPPKHEEEDEPGLSLGHFSVGGNSRVVFEDRSGAETVRLEAQPLDISLNDLDSDHPERDSGFDIKTSVGEASIAAAGTARPFADPISGRMEGTIKALELPPLSPYLAEVLGVRLQTGHFDGSFKGASVKGALDGKLDVELSNLFIAPPDPNAPMAKKMDLPIETVLDLLRDGEDRIRLSLPIRGKLDNPDLDVSDAVAQAVAGALKSTMLTTLKLAFPVVALISMAVDAEDNTRMALAPLAFPLGSDILSDDNRKTLATVADLMRARPGLKLTLCGKANAEDWPSLVERQRAEARPLLTRLERAVGVRRDAADAGPVNRDALGGLAANRADTAKEYLVDHAGIDAGRLFACRPEVETVANAAKGPRVDLLL